MRDVCQVLTVFVMAAYHHTSMTTLNISLPDPLKQYIEKRTAKGGYSSSSEYVRGLIREDKDRRAKEELENKLLEGLASGPSTEMTRADWDDLRRQIKSGQTQRKRA